MPIRMFSFFSGRWLITKVLRQERKLRDMRAICAACLSPFLTGSPDTTWREHSYWSVIWRQFAIESILMKLRDAKLLVKITSCLYSILIYKLDSYCLNKLRRIGDKNLPCTHRRWFQLYSNRTFQCTYQTQCTDRSACPTPAKDVTFQRLDQHLWFCKNV